ncbi:hypothetical protein GNT69_22330 [Bacillus sp. B15-48]|nr:hypothetical protein [Bacillus sp. B15-48]
MFLRGWLMYNRGNRKRRKEEESSLLEFKKANVKHINEIIEFCSHGQRDTYNETHCKDYIKEQKYFSNTEEGSIDF